MFGFVRLLISVTHRMAQRSRFLSCPPIRNFATLVKHLGRSEAIK